jgi:hypothetical protein
MANKQKVTRGLAFGLVAGWVVGMIWWTALVISLGPSVAVTHDGDGWHEEHTTILGHVAYAPLMAIPWGVVGGVVGAVIGWKGGWLEVLTSFAGTVCGLGMVLALGDFDGWLTFTMPPAAFLGTFLGLAVGGVTSAVRQGLKV